LKGLLTLFNATADHAVTDSGSKTAHSRSFFQREDIDGLDIDRFQVRIALRDRHFGAQTRQARLNAYALEWNLDLARRHQTTVQRCDHECYSFCDCVGRGPPRGPCFQMGTGWPAVQGRAGWPQRDAPGATAGRSPHRL